MPSVMTLEGTGRRRLNLFGFGDAWSDDASATEERPLEEMTTSFISWGILAFAIGTVAVRGYEAGRHFFKKR